MNHLETIFAPERIDRLIKTGVLIFDVDDTLLARSSRPGEADSSFADSIAAQNLVGLLRLGLRIAFVTGHGWGQLKRRLIDPLIEAVSSFPLVNVTDLIHVYANRGATRIDINRSSCTEDKAYGDKFRIGHEDAEVIRGIFNELTQQLNADRQDKQNLPIDYLPPKIVERDGVVIALRPIDGLSQRDVLVEHGGRLLAGRGLAGRYEISACGRSTIEVIRRGGDKSVAVADLFNRLASKTGAVLIDIQKSSIYIGDEFDANGNDRIVLDNFPDCTCFSVAAVTGNKKKSLIDASQIIGGSRVNVCAKLIEYIERTLVQNS